MKMFEYLASGRAIVASDLPVMHEVLDDDTAVFCEPDNLQAWLNALQDLIANENKRNLLGQNAKHASKKYSWVARAQNALNGWNE